jgi:hypothetical protein
LQALKGFNVKKKINCCNLSHVSHSAKTKKDLGPVFSNTGTSEEQRIYDKFRKSISNLPEFSEITALFLYAQNMTQM